jgi:hypothetical protein
VSATDYNGSTPKPRKKNVKMITDESEYIIPDSDFIQEVFCTYKEEQYFVRDNGAVLRLPRDNNKSRPTDNKWTFGKLNRDTGYLEIAAERVHRIVATAFNGESPTKEHVVDHIDTNKQNNRPENLRWVTRLENILLNPITYKRIELVCGSVEAFLSNPSKFRDLFPEPNYQWMCSVSKEEAQMSLKNLTEWANSDKSSSGGKLGEWIYNRGKTLDEQKINEIFKQVEKKTGINRQALCSNKARRNEYYEARKYAAKQLRLELNLSDYEISKLIGISESTVNQYIEISEDWYNKDYAKVSEKHHKILSERSQIIPQNVIQKNWGTQSQFPCCPQEVLNNPIAEYAALLEENAIFFQNIFYFTTVVKKAIIEEEKSLLVLYNITKKEGIDKRWGIMKIKFENEKFEHEIILNYNRTLEHYWLIDVENHFKSIIEGSDWSPIYDSQGKEFKGDYMPF